ncbi:MAG: NUDIX hydrolase [Candidatus Dormibacteraeota bacterium]|nr:NUDIX hydrolase [Candidatus Dormibacteraeota bacterium]
MSTSLVSLASLLNSFEPMTPQIRVAAVAVRERQVLVVEHRKRGRRYWVLPGGRVEAGEALVSALRRELGEELGLVAEVGQLLAVYETLAPDRHTVNLAFAVEVGGQQPRIDRDDPVLAGWQWMALARLHHVDFRPPIAPVLTDIIVGEDRRGPVRLLGDTWTTDRT